MKKVLFLIGIAGAIGFASCENGSGCSETWYQDLDGDGKGNPAVTLSECDQPAGYVADNTDVMDNPISRLAVPTLTKITGETCGPCGGWGWGAWSNLSHDYLGQAFSWANYGTGFSNSFFRNQEINPFMDPWENNFEDGGSKPNFACNGIDFGTTAANAENAANNFLNATPDVAAAFSYTLEGGDLTINASAKFFENVNSEYWMGAYVVENKAIGPQAGAAGANGDPEHHFVMRGSCDSNPWGQALASGSVNAGDIFDLTYTATIPPSFIEENLSYGVIIWRKVGGKYAFVNSFSNQGK